ncbi:hypothetical protein FPS10_21800 [Pseudoruegeria sp. M32A2M]|nr:hypothetical protein [Pseudoruegeria sp. M32A2M]
MDQSNQVLPLDATLAANIATSISAAVSFCEALPKAYLVDCMGERLDWIATTLPAGTANDEIRKVLDDASRKIEKVARENRDRSQPRIRVKTPGPNPVSTSRPLIAVKPEAQAAAVAETAAILEEASALLLRSSSRSQEHAEHYRTIAAALDSSALLLRS